MEQWWEGARVGSDRFFCWYALETPKTKRSNKRVEHSNEEVVQRVHCMAIVLIWTSLIDFFIACKVHPTQCTTDKYLISCVPISYTYFMWMLQTTVPYSCVWRCAFRDRQGVPCAHTCAQQCATINATKVLSPSQWRLFSPCVPSDRHVQTRLGQHRSEGRGFLTSWPKASRGFLISGAGQLGIGCWPLTQRPRLTEK